jgi:hypothetical protein
VALFACGLNRMGILSMPNSYLESICPDVERSDGSYASAGGWRFCLSPGTCWFVSDSVAPDSADALDLAGAVGSTGALDSQPARMVTAYGFADDVSLPLGPLGKFGPRHVQESAGSGHVAAGAVGRGLTMAVAVLLNLGSMLPPS